jgi:regulator of PEP synthase PpsR (kinase-PPPase family)
MKEIQLSRPKLAFVLATRAIRAAGVALLLADRLNAGQRKAVGSTLALVGLVTTIPARLGNIREARVQKSGS